jgi:N-acetylglucosaminyl-diphospho-decaprenol L-rhamnosyltransferase
VVNTDGREHLLACLAAIARTHPPEVSHELLVLDNASGDGSVEAVRERHPEARLIALERRTGKAENDSRLLQESRGRFCLLLNEDSELRPGAVAALHEAITAHPKAGAAGAMLVRPDGVQQPSAWRFPSPRTALIGALFLHRRLTVQSTGTDTREVDWAQSAALLVDRAAAAEIGWFDPAFFVYSDEVDFCKRLRDAGWTTLYVPAAVAVHHEQLSTGAVPERRIVELSRNRDRYMRKHHSPSAATTVRVLTAWAYALRSLAAFFVPGHSPRRYWRHVTATLRPERGEGLREAAVEHNRGRRL